MDKEIIDNDKKLEKFIELIRSNPEVPQKLSEL